jgi:hypothetical protein
LNELGSLLSGQGLDTVFKVPNNFLAVYAQSHLGKKNVKRDAESVNAITTASAQFPADRVIHFRENPPKFGTVIHQLFLWLSHTDFFTGFRSRSAGPNVGISRRRHYGISHAEDNG